MGEVSSEPSMDLISRKGSDDGQDAMFDIAPSWSDYWDGMPEFSAVELKPIREITMQFLTDDDYRAFVTEVGIKPLSHQKRAWWPEPYRPSRGEVHWLGSPSPTRYPIYIPSKGRADVATTPKLLDQAGIDYRIVVESIEAEQYRKVFGADKILELPFHDLGQGSIPARNWIWEHAISGGHPWHWIIDDNVQGFYRAHGNKRLTVRESSAPLRMVEDFADRYKNLAFAGLNDVAFMPDTSTIPMRLNTRVYSVTLINSELPYRWRGRYNEDTDLCLRALKDGWATILFCNMLMDKPQTARGDGSGGTKGGNTDHVYSDGDNRRAFAESLKEQHPDVTEIVWKFDRWHHQVDYSRFKGNRLIARSDAPIVSSEFEYGLRLVRASK